MDLWQAEVLNMSFSFIFSMPDISEKEYLFGGALFCALLMFLGIYVLPGLIRKYFIGV